MTPNDQTELILFRINQISESIKALSDEVKSLSSIGASVNVLQVQFVQLHSEVEKLKNDIEVLKASRWQFVGAIGIIAIVWQFIAGSIQKALGM
jgi:hypothetical protein